jgi:hypothetical protein
MAAPCDLSIRQAISAASSTAIRSPPGLRSRANQAASETECFCCLEVDDQIELDFIPRSETRGVCGSPPCRSAWDDLGLHRQQALALQFLPRKFASAANGFRFFANLPLRGFLVVSAELHLAEYTLALHLLLQHPEGLIDIVVTNENLHERFS